MAVNIISLTSDVKTSIQRWSKLPDPVTKYSQTPRGRFCAWVPYDTVTGSGTGDQDRFNLTVTFPNNFAYRINQVRWVVGLDGASAGTLANNAYAPEYEMRGIWGPTFQTTGTLYVDHLMYGSMKGEAADSSASINTTTIKTAGFDPGKSWLLEKPPVVLREFQTTSSGVVLPQVSAAISIDQIITVTDPAATGDWAYYFFLDAFMYDLDQILEAEFNTPAIVFN